MDLTKTLKAVVLLDADGKRLLAKSFDEATSSRQFERKLFVKTKTHRIKDEIVILDGMLVLHRFVADIHLYVVGGRNENPLVLDSLMSCLAEVISSLLSKVVERQSLLDHLAPVIVALDEMCDNGVILETDSNLVLQRVSLKDEVAEQSMAQKLQSATEYVKFPWIRSSG